MATFMYKELFDNLCGSSKWGSQRFRLQNDALCGEQFNLRLEILFQLFLNDDFILWKWIFKNIFIENF